jgi:hypothetical protein
MADRTNIKEMIPALPDENIGKLINILAPPIQQLTKN